MAITAVRNGSRSPRLVTYVLDGELQEAMVPHGTHKLPAGAENVVLGGDITDATPKAKFPAKVLPKPKAPKPKDKPVD